MKTTELKPKRDGRVRSSDLVVLLVRWDKDVALWERVADKEGGTLGERCRARAHEIANCRRELQEVMNEKQHNAPGSSEAGGSAHWSQCFLEHAARETAWMREHAKHCDYASAHLAGVRREVWLFAALLAQEKSAPNAELTGAQDKPKA